MNNQWSLLWSKRQNALHIETLDTALSKNRNLYRDDRYINDYIPIFVGTKEECHAAADNCRKTMAERQFYGETA